MEKQLFLTVKKMFLFFTTQFHKFLFDTNLHKNILLYAEIIRKISANQEFSNATNNEREIWFKNIQDELLSYIERMYFNIKATPELLDADILISPKLNLGFTEYNKYLNNIIFQPDRDMVKLNEIIRLLN